MSKAQNTPGIGRRRFRPYPEYKDSGVKWLATVPSSWRICAVKHRFDIFLGKMLQPEPASPHDLQVPYLKAVNIQWENIGLNSLQTMWASKYEIQTGQVAIGDLLVCEGGEVGRAAIIDQKPEEPIIIQNALHRVRSQSEMPKLLMYLLEVSASGGWLEVECNKATIQHFTRDKFGSLRIALPSLDEQCRIVSFLDRETAKIDALIEKKERLIELLQEKRTALITQVVTKGLDPTVHMKDSGVEWLGDIPAHWMVKRLWHLTPSDRRIMYGIVLPGPNVDAGVPIVKGGDVSLERLRIDKLNRTTFEIESGYVRSRLRGGDLVYAIRGSIGEAAIVPEELTGANLTQDAARISYTPATYGAWLLYMLKSAVTFAQLEAGALGATIKGINIRDLKRAIVPVPPRIEQQAIASYLETSTARIDALIGEIGEVITRLNEYRTTLIFEAVTGKIDIRTGHLLDEGPGYLSA